MNTKNQSRNVFWPSHIRINGETHAIRDLIKTVDFFLAVAGSSKAGGWALYLVHRDGREQQISPCFWLDQGDRLKDLIGATERHLGHIMHAKNYVKRPELPARDQWNWATVEAPAEPKAPEPVTAADDIAHYTLEASKRPGVPLYDNLDIPADVAEDIDAANWSVGCGLTDTRGRREVFRQRRAEAYAAMYPDHAAELAAEKAAQVERPELAEFQSGKTAIICKHFQAIGRGTRAAPVNRMTVIEHRAELIPQAARTGYFPVAVRIGVNVHSDNPNTIYNRLKVELGRDPTTNEIRDDVRRILAEYEQPPEDAREIAAASYEAEAAAEEAERLGIDPTGPVYTAMGRAWNEDEKEYSRLVERQFSTRAEAKAYRDKVETLSHDGDSKNPGRLVGVICDTNGAAKVADAAAGFVAIDPIAGW